MTSIYTIKNGWLKQAETNLTYERSSPISYCPSPYCDDRGCSDICLLVVHNISLPPGQFGGPYIDQLFTGCLDPNEHEYFQEIHQLKVSAHCLVKRDGQVVQYVPFDKRAWHAGVSEFHGRTKCNDFSIGIELEGCDDLPYTMQQYQQLVYISQAIKAEYPEINDNSITGHSDIAPGRKTDPGEYFDWKYYKAKLKQVEEGC
ncbi:1,6-anhydro-N-acetylmuramyl-L-alanine amidase AmpD [Thalassotalea mangrovi]|uniref:1,6-anhydro-N-acetylmuramyl-L-alanine amidase AmpD n=2 Tax=Thalassotalea mangrovi TaxID=2572245 RepID=A0A4U1B918_9GAMM|nr:1,6-anhydro-N-acetylmuramyl-L-alanine amidase AmpD [Thalassotalea mangrovi]